MSDSLMRQDNQLLSNLLAYHQLSKHHLQGYAAGPETLDWDDQPDPFRSFEQTDFIELPLAKPDHLRVSSANMFAVDAEQQPLTLENLALYLQFSAGLSAWKTLGVDRWSLRTVPSSGNLHPGELYLILPKTGFSKAGLYHYNAYHHRLTLRALHADNSDASVYMIQTSVLQREAWKYGVRSLRYCWLDAGHQLTQCQAVSGLLGWKLENISVSRELITQLCGLGRAEYSGVEKEYPEWICQLYYSQTDTADKEPLVRIFENQELTWRGKPNRLAADPLQTWPQAFSIVDQLDQSVTAFVGFPASGGIPLQYDGLDLDPWQMILARRSGQAYMSEHCYPRHLFEQMIAALQPDATRILPDQPQVHLLCFVHSVEGLPPGIYLIPRTKQGGHIFSSELNRWQPWEEVSFAGTDTAWRMKTANTRKAAGQLCCNQVIAAASCFTLIFLAEFEQRLSQSQGNAYPDLYLEAGMLGQQLYLHSTAQGYSGTGIGCFFDDAIHELIGLETQSLQALYGFAVGDPIRDQRITQLSGYYHLRERFL